MTQLFDLQPKKWPKQERSKATFDALVEACTLVLPRLGYAGTTTNHIADAAGVGIASLYEYFPGKDALIAQVVEKFSEQLLQQLMLKAEAIWGAPENQLMRLWLYAIYDTLNANKDLYRVLSYEVPFTYQIHKMKDIGEKLILFSEALQTGALPILPHKQSRASLYLIVSLVSGALSQWVLDPPQDVPLEELISELSNKLNQWIFEKR
jgi:AcrR family transcriptional regulator